MQSVVKTYLRGGKLVVCAFHAAPGEELTSYVLIGRRKDSDRMSEILEELQRQVRSRDEVVNVLGNYGRKIMYQLTLELLGKQNPSLIQAFSAAKKNVLALEGSVLPKSTLPLAAMNQHGAASARDDGLPFSRMASGASRYAGRFQPLGASRKQDWPCASSDNQAARKSSRIFQDRRGNHRGRRPVRRERSWPRKDGKLMPRGNRPRLLDTVLQNKGMGGQAKAFNEMLLGFSSDEAKIDYNSAFHRRKWS